MSLPVSYAERYERATVAQRRKIIAKLDPQHQRALLTGTPWWWWGRTDQLAPAGDWRWWVINAGRGWGKTRTGAEWCMTQVRRYPGCLIALVAPTIADARDVMVEGPSGLLSVLSSNEMRHGSVEQGWNRSMGEVFFGNGSEVKLFTSEKPRQLRGPNHHFAWGDEPSYWNDATKGTDKDSTFYHLNIGLRLPGIAGWPMYQPRGCMTMTPRMVPLLKVPDDVMAEFPARAGLLQRDDVHLTTGSTMANLRNLDPHYYRSVIAPQIGTTMGLQELGGILLEDVEGALWHTAQLARMREGLPDVEDLAKTVVGFDPSGDAGGMHDEHGIIVASSSGYRDQLRLWVREDYSLNGDPTQACRAVILAAQEFMADAIVYEKNQGQAWIPTTLRAVYDVMRHENNSGLRPDWVLPTLDPVDALTSKAQRARPVQSLYEQDRVRHVGTFPILEGQMTTWVPGESNSPDRLDALVWALRWLYGMGPMQVGIASPAQRDRGRGGRRRPDAPNSRMPVTYGARSR